MELKKFYALDVVLVCGLPGSGKSHFAKAFFNIDDRKRINRVEIRKLLYEMTSFGDAWREEYFNEHDDNLVKHVERKIFEHFLHDGKKVLIDNTSVSASSRSHYLKIAEKMNRTAGIIFLNIPLQKCQLRNSKRADPISDTVISNLYARIQLPSRAEGFREALIVNDY